MPRGSNPNSRKNLKSGKNATSFTAENAAEMQKKSTKAKRMYKSLTEDLKERLTPERVAKMNERILVMAEHGNIAAWEKIRDTIGEKPSDKVEITGNINIADTLKAARERARAAKEKAAKTAEPEPPGGDDG